jgi:glycosyltransferase involved in cell wall biosynthesis
VPELLSIVVPAFNEAPVINEFHARISKVLTNIEMNCELIYVDDGSSDNTVAILNELRESDKSIAVIELSRNFGKTRLNSSLSFCASGATAMMWFMVDVPIGRVSRG